MWIKDENWSKVRSASTEYPRTGTIRSTFSDSKARDGLRIECHRPKCIAILIYWNLLLSRPKRWPIGRQWRRCRRKKSLTFAYYAGDFVIIFNVADVFFHEDGARGAFQVLLRTCIVALAFLLLVDLDLLHWQLIVIHLLRMARVLLCYLIHHDSLRCKHLLLLLLLLSPSELNNSLRKSLIQVLVIPCTPWTWFHPLLVISCVSGRVGSLLLAAIEFLRDWHGVAAGADPLDAVQFVGLASWISSSFTALERLHFNSYFNFIISKINLSINP